MTAENQRFPILVVDDDEPTQRLLQAVLRRAGFESEVASNGAAAIKRLESGSNYAAVILDVMMPTVSGHEVVEFMTTKADPVPVIVCSAASPQTLKGFDTRVVKAVVRKPFDVEQFIAMIGIVARR